MLFRSGPGYCEGVISGQKRIYSLRDAKGQPHVTIEVQPNNILPRWDDVRPYLSAAEKEAKKLPNGYTDQDIGNIAAEMAKKAMPPEIFQIKGKGNRKPNEEYLPFVQDFVRSGQWSDVGDLQNSNLIDIRRSSLPWPQGTTSEQIDALVGGMIGGTKTPRFTNETLIRKAREELGNNYVTEKE